MFLIAALFDGVIGRGAAIDAVNPVESADDDPDGCAGLLLLHAAVAAIIVSAISVQMCRYVHTNHPKIAHGCAPADCRVKGP